MPIRYARRLSGHARRPRADRHLGYLLAFVAGATNAGGFLAVRQYTSHMTGIVSAMADNLVLGTIDLVLDGAGALTSFVAGAVVSSLLINYARRRNLVSRFALPLLLEAVLLLAFGFLGLRLSTIGGLFVPVTVMLLCFIMGLQNALITKLSNAEIRTTHMTGIVTDIGIEVGRLLYWNATPSSLQPKVVADRTHLAVLLRLLGFFFLGGVVGAVGFKRAGYVATIPLALALITVAMVPVLDDLRIGARRWRRK